MSQQAMDTPRSQGRGVALSVVSEARPSLFGDEDRGDLGKAMLGSREWADRELKDDKPSRPRVKDVINSLVGAPLYIENCHKTNWLGSSGQKLTVTRFYPKGVIVDCPKQDEAPGDVEEKIALFRRLKITYVLIRHGEAVTTDEFNRRLMVAQSESEEA